MSRAVHPEVKAADAGKYVAMLANPLDPLAEEVGKAVAREVRALSRKAPKAAKGKVGRATTAKQPGIEVLETRITNLVTQVLEQSLSSRTAQGKALRMALIAKLAHAEAGGAEDASLVQSANADALLTTAEAATRLEVSRPYVSMLCDSGKLGQVVTTEGGHRRIRASAVQAYLSTRTKQHERAVSPRQAGVEAGLYDYPEWQGTVLRAAEPAKKAATTKKTARKPRS
jgi:excisionase family DNA binding protein